MEQGVRAQRSHKKAGHHHLDPKPEAGYTDEAAIEAHDLIDNAEENAHVSSRGTQTGFPFELYI